MERTSGSLCLFSPSNPLPHSITLSQTPPPSLQPVLSLCLPLVLEARGESDTVGEEKGKVEFGEQGEREHKVVREDAGGNERKGEGGVAG